MQQTGKTHTSHSHHLGYVDENTGCTCNHVPEQGTYYGSITEYEACLRREYRVRFPSSFQLNLLQSRDLNWRPPTSKQASHLLTAFLGTLQRSCLETLASSLQPLPKNKDYPHKIHFRWPHISATECKSGTIQNLPIAVNTTNELKNVTTTSDNIGTSVSWNILCWAPLLSDVVVTYFSSIVKY